MLTVNVERTMIGRTISHYRIVEKLGEGGMGVVYKAEDTRLRRMVVLKFLRGDLLESGEHKERFLREGQAAASLDHSNICTVHEINETAGFLVMAFVEGQSVKDKIAERPLKLEDALDIAIQTARGLEAAHDKGVVHRDVKPPNLMVNVQGQVKIMDFGLAQLTDRTRLTHTDTVLGTPAYMSPEQAEGQPTDRTTDVWSLGVVIYEMVTGRVPFGAERLQAVLYAIVHQEPEPLTALRVGVPLELDRIVSKALAKRAAERYQHIAEMRIDLQAVVRALGQSDRSEETEGAAVAVLPFVNLNRDEESEFFSDGITEDIISALARVPGLRVAARSSVFQFKGAQPVVQEVGRKLKVNAVLEGTVRRAGKRLRVTAELVGVRDGYQIWSERFDRVLEDVFDIQDEISQAICEKLQVHLLGGRENPIKRYTGDVHAYNMYLKGRYWWNRRTQGGLAKAKEYFAQAIEHDPSYALAYAGLGDCYAMLVVYDLANPNESFPKAKAAQLRALEIDPNLAVAHAALGFAELYYDWDPTKAERRLLRAIELNPDYPSAHQWYGMCLGVTGRLDKACAEMNRANELDPLSASINFTRLWPLYWGRGFKEAIQQYRQVVEDHGDFWAAHYYLGLCLLQNGQISEAIAEMEKARGLSDNAGRLCGLSYAYASAGRVTEARAELNEMIELSKHKYVSAYRVAAAYVGLGEKDQAFIWLEKALVDRCWDLIFCGMEPLFDPVRSDPRFSGIQKRIVPA